MTRPSPVQHRRVLVVEDHLMIADDLQHALEQAGVVVIGPAPTVAAALRLLAATPVLDGAILDIDLHGLPSFPVADTLRLRDIPFAFYTDHEVTILPAAYRGIRRFTKPADLQEMVRVVLASANRCHPLHRRQTSVFRRRHIERPSHPGPVHLVGDHGSLRPLGSGLLGR
jgi:DNA-binding response OmpR family regulator